MGCLVRPPTVSGRVRAVTLVLLLLAAGGAPGHAAAGGGAVATEHALAARAGADVLAAGGSAVDAAIAAAAAVCVVHPSSCGIGGGGLALVHLADGRDVALDYRERAPAAVTAARYAPNGAPDPALSRTGGLAVGVPGEVAGWVALHDRFGRLPLAQVLAPAIRLARDGFALSATPHLGREIGRSATLLAADPGLAAVFLDRDGKPPAADAVLRQADLARTLEAIADDAGAGFYRGALAAAIVAAVQAHGGVLTTDDLAHYRPVWRKPLAGRLRGRRIVSYPPPGSGGIVLEALGMLTHDEPAVLGAGGASWLHLLSGVLAQAFADRARFYGDPDFTPVPTAELLAPPRLAGLRARLSATRIVAPTAQIVPDAGTANVSVVNAQGDAVALTTTINTGFGAGLLVPGAGIVLNNEMDDFALAAGVANVYGLTGDDPNLVAAGKRPQSSMSPTIVLDRGRPELVVGASGGPFIISGIIQVILGVTAFGRDLPDAVALPRIHDQGSPPVLAAEAGIDATARAALTRLGHRIVDVPAVGAVSAAGLRPDRTPVAAGDFRKDGGAAVVP